MRNWILKTAFASSAALALFLCIAWPMQEWIIKPFFSSANPATGLPTAAENTTKTLSYLWFPFVLVLATLERRISSALDRPMVAGPQSRVEQAVEVVDRGLGRTLLAERAGEQLHDVGGVAEKKIRVATARRARLSSLVHLLKNHDDQGVMEVVGKAP